VRLRERERLTRFRGTKGAPLQEPTQAVNVRFEWTASQSSGLCDGMLERPRAPHPVIWLLLYLPFGALTGFVTVALTFLASQHGLSISESSLLTGAQMLVSWLKWLWAPIVDITLTPKKWYTLATVGTALGVLTMSAMPLSPSALPALLFVIAATSLVNSIVGMAIEALIAGSVEDKQIGRVSGWFQAGNLGGAGLGGGLGLVLMKNLPAPWMGGAILAALFIGCTLALRFGADVPSHQGKSAVTAVRAVVQDLKLMLKTQGGLSAAVLCFLPVGTGALQAVLSQEKVAAVWGAGVNDVALLQGFGSGLITAVGCFVGGAVCTRLHPRVAYSLFGAIMATVAMLMIVLPKTQLMYIALNMAYAFTTGLAFAGFTALVLDGMGRGSGATKYNVFASLSNFPIWWLGLLLAWSAQHFGPKGADSSAPGTVEGIRAMLLVEAGCGILGVALFFFAHRLIRSSNLATTV
jgi:MFS transporter, PAT family, beta-lactamase induction signal transducer AmpG